MNERAAIVAPAIPRNKYALPPVSLRFMPRLADIAEHPAAWAWPGAQSDRPWVNELRRLYEEPLSFPASMSPQCGLLLHSLILNMRPRVTVEVGSFIGASTLWIAGALRECPVSQLQTFDDFGPVAAGPWRETGFGGDRLDVVRQRVARAGLADLVSFHPGDSGTRLLGMREHLRALGGVDAAFIDGDHSIAGATRDFWAIEPVLNTGGYVMLHDTIPDQCGGHEGPRYVLDRANEIGQGLYERCDLHLSPLNYGFGILRRIG
ncbi:MAG: class I SAM-dependent methyltransferase [Phycisphaerales bacterium]|nr:class I SAM-dependent methyltransferase [Phycisphaerales bacterium]